LPGFGASNNYSLISVVRNKVGRDKTVWGAGHYITWAKRTGVWFSMNDSIVTALDDLNLTADNANDHDTQGIPYAFCYVNDNL
jgi:ubiquitin C-terminal hydrolase